MELLSCTQINPFIETTDDPFLAGGSTGHDLRHWGNPSSFTDQDKLIEYAGRVCYHSTENMGKSSSFIKARLAEGHEDLIEHVCATLAFYPWESLVSPLLWRNYNPYCVVGSVGRQWVVTANLRAWRSLCMQLPGLGQVVQRLSKISPSTFIASETLAEMAPELDTHTADQSRESSRNSKGVAGIGWRKVGQARVTLLAANYPQWTVPQPEYWNDHGSATFLLDNVSRALTHQLVRHRLFSFSQESQRYVSLEKGGWQAIIPPSIADNRWAKDLLQTFWASAGDAYNSLRNLGIKKEDARFLLPNAAATRIVVSGTFAGWRHFNEQRSLDRAAQWEIHDVGQAILKQLWMVAPSVFEDQYGKAAGQST